MIKLNLIKSSVLFSDGILANTVSDDAFSQPYRSSSRAAVESELHVSVHKVDGQKVPAGRVVAVKQRPVRRGRAKCHLKLDEGQVAARRLRPRDDGVRKHRLVEERRGQSETCAAEKTGRAANVFLNVHREHVKVHAGAFTAFVNRVRKKRFSELDSSLLLFFSAFQ